jgi:DNA-binding NtrC family response regulator
MIYATTGTKSEPRRQASVTLGAVNGKPTIFVVEDDGSIRRFICTILRYATTAMVVEAADPYAALSIARKIGGAIDVLISDIDLSARMNGIKLARELAMTNPSMKVLLMSAADCPECEIPAAWRFLAKPFTTQNFLDRVGALLPSPSAAQSFWVGH